MMKRTSVFFVGLMAFLIASASFCNAAAQPNKTQRTPDGLILALPNGKLKVAAVTNNILHIQFAPGASIPQRKSLIVVAAKRPPVVLRVLNNTGAVTLSTKKIAATISLTTGAITFADATGNVKLREREDGGKTLTPATISGEKVFTIQQNFTLTPDEGLYGLGQYQEGVMNWRNHNVSMAQVNTNVTVPMMLSTRGYGILWDNYSLTRFHDGTDGMSLWSDVADGIDYYFIYGPSPDAVIAGYRTLTGAAPMFGKWAYGYWQSKEKYATGKELVDVAKEYRARKLPIDNIVQDWMYWGKYGWGAMKFDESLYPHMEKTVAELHKLNFHIMLSIWPKFEPKSAIYLEMDKKGHLFKGPDGAAVYDAHSEEARQIYWRYAKEGLFSKGIDAWWMDATEPEVTGGRSAEVHAEAMKKMSNLSIGTTARYLNTFALMTTQGMYTNLRKNAPKKRVFILTRSGFAGQQRNAAATWSGDIEAEWGVLRKQISGGLNFGMAGVPYWTTDIGAFFVRYAGGSKNDEYRELYVRWFQFGTFCPLFRSHGTHTPREIWQFGQPGDWAYGTLEKFDNLRYRLLPYIYSLAWKVTSDGYTIMRGLPFDYPNDPQTYTINDQFMFGPAFLVNPVTNVMYNKEKVNAIAKLLKDNKTEVKIAIVTDWKVKSRKVYLPKSTWYDFWTGERLDGARTIDATSPIDIMPLYVRAGSIVPMGPKLQYAVEKPEDPIELRIYPGADGRFTIYEDENDNYNYEKGAYALIPIAWDDSAKKLTIGDRKGSFPGMLKSRTFDVVIVRPGHGSGVDEIPAPNKVVKYSGKSVSVTFAIK